MKYCRWVASSNIEAVRALFLRRSEEECGGVRRSVVELTSPISMECGGGSWIVLEGVGLWWSVVE